MHPDPQHIPAFIQAIEPVIRHYGYLAVGGLVLLEDFGLPLPGETILIAAAFYAGLGQLNIILIAVIGIVGAIIGDNIGYVIGSYGGHPLLERYGKYILLTPKRVHKAEDFFNAHGQIVIVARFIEGLKQANGIIAGLSEMSWSTFLKYNVIGAVLWGGLWSILGYYGGNHINSFLRYDLYISIAVGVIVLGLLTRQLFKKLKAR